MLNLCTIVISKLMPISANPWIAAVQQDQFYSLLLPCLLPVALLFVYLNWLGMKLYRHN